MASWFCNYNQYDNFFKFWVNILLLLLLYLNDLKLGIRNTIYFCKLIMIQFLRRMMWHAMHQQGVTISSQPHDLYH